MIVAQVEHAVGVNRVNPFDGLFSRRRKSLPQPIGQFAFAPGSAATSTISLMGVQLWQTDDTRSYDMAIFRSLSVSFWRWLTSSAAEFGYEVTGRS